MKWISVIIAATLAGVAGFLLLAFLLFTEQRTTGSIYVCESCSSILRQDTQLHRVSVWSNDRLVTRNTLCDKCSTQIVACVVADKCRNCGKIYNSRQMTAQRSARKQNETNAIGFCSEACQHRTVTLSQSCSWCGKVYYRSTKVVDFDAPDHDRSTTQGFCSYQCQALAAAQPATNKGDVVTLPPQSGHSSGSAQTAQQPQPQGADGTAAPADSSGGKKNKGKSPYSEAAGQALTEGIDIIDKFLQSREPTGNTARGTHNR